MTALEQQLNLATNVERLWAALMPDVEMPTKAQFLRWAGMAPEPVLVRAINRAYRKHGRVDMTAEEVARYVTGVARGEMQKATDQIETQWNR